LIGGGEFNERSIESFLYTLRCCDLTDDHNG
jgi:hypothetical protein